MSSNAYSATLKPDPWLRILVLTVGRLLFAAGLVLILSLPLDAVVRASGSALWLVLGVYELGRLQRGFASCSAVRIRCDGSVEVWCRGETLRRFAPVLELEYQPASRRNPLQYFQPVGSPAAFQASMPPAM